MTSKMNIEEDIKILKDKAKALNEHIKDYEESSCTASDVYRAIKEEKEAIESVLADRKRLEDKANKYNALVEKIKEYCTNNIKKLNSGEILSIRGMLKDILEISEEEEV